MVNRSCSRRPIRVRLFCRHLPSPQASSNPPQAVDVTEQQTRLEIPPQCSQRSDNRAGVIEYACLWRFFRELGGGADGAGSCVFTALRGRPDCAAYGRGADDARIAAVAVLAGLAACSSHPDFYPTKGDAKPHPAWRRPSSIPSRASISRSWQGPVDLASVRASGTQFAFIKATEGGDHVDDRFRTNWDGAAAAGIPRGAYHFVFWCRSAREQMNWFKKNVPNDPTALPRCSMWNGTGHSQTCPRKLPKEQALAKVKDILEEMERYTGKRPIIYTDITFHKDVLEGELPIIRTGCAPPRPSRSSASSPALDAVAVHLDGPRPRRPRRCRSQRLLRHAFGMGLVPLDRCDPRDHKRLASQGYCTDKYERFQKSVKDLQFVKFVRNWSIAEQTRAG